MLSTVLLITFFNLLSFYSIMLIKEGDFMLDRIFDLNKIHNTINNFSDSLKEEYYNYLINEFGVLFTFHSNHIEGVNSTLTLNDTKEIINNTYDFNSVIDDGKKREIYETINH